MLAESFYTTQDDFDQEEVFPLSFTNKSFLGSVPTLSNSFSESNYSTSIDSSNDRPALLSSYSSDNISEQEQEQEQENREFFLNNDPDDIFQLESDFTLQKKQELNYNSNSQSSRINFDTFYDAFANVAQQNYRVWVSSV